MRKCDSIKLLCNFIEIGLRHGGSKSDGFGMGIFHDRNHTSAWVFSYKFQNIFF